jgi:hypothetical protein
MSSFGNLGSLEVGRRTPSSLSTRTDSGFHSGGFWISIGRGILTR